MGAIEKHPSTASHRCLYLYRHLLTGSVQLHHEAATQVEAPWPHGRGDHTPPHRAQPMPHVSVQRASLKPPNFSSKESKTKPNPASHCCLCISLSLSNAVANRWGILPHINPHIIWIIIQRRPHVYLGCFFFPFLLLWLPSFYGYHHFCGYHLSVATGWLRRSAQGKLEVQDREGSPRGCRSPGTPPSHCLLYAASSSWYELSDQNKEET